MNTARAFIQYLEKDRFLTADLAEKGWQPAEIARIAHQMGFDFSMSDLRTAIREHGVTPLTSQMGGKLYSDLKQPKRYAGSIPNPRVMVVQFNAGTIA